MSTVKIKTEPTAATAAVTVDVQVKLEPSLSTTDFKLEQHTSDIDTKLESDSDTDREEDVIKSESSDEDDEDTDQNQFTIIPKKLQQLVCKHPGCDHIFNFTGNLNMHQHEHRLHAELNVLGKNYTLVRQSLNDSWPCPISDCKGAFKTVNAASGHIRRSHISIMRQQQQQQQPLAQITQRRVHFVDMDNFYVNGFCCGYHKTTGLFICHECRLVPECLLTHIQQIHGYVEKSINNSVLPDSAVNTGADPSTNQHTSNPLLAAAIRNPHWQQHPDIVQGWLCVTSDCGYCGYTATNKRDHKRKVHHGEQLTTIPALVLCLFVSKKQVSHFFITRIGQTSGVFTTSSDGMNRHRFDYSQNGLNTKNENEEDDNQNEITETSNQRRQWKCEYPDCRRLFSSSDKLSMHRREHKLEVMINVCGCTFALSRQPSDNRWVCPIPECEATFKTVETTRFHIKGVHSTSVKQKRTKCDDDDDNDACQQDPVIKKRKHIINYVKMDAFYISGTRCGYHIMVGVFICHECRVVPECLLTHLQQKHGYNEKSIDNSVLPESAVTANVDPNINQHTSNPDLAAVIREPNWQQHQNVVQGWLCLALDCGYCHFINEVRNKHQRVEHRGEQISTVPALVLRLPYGKALTSCFLITRLGTTTANSVKPNDSSSQYFGECGEDDDDELVLSDYSDEDEIY